MIKMINSTDFLDRRRMASSSLSSLFPSDLLPLVNQYCEEPQIVSLLRYVTIESGCLIKPMDMGCVKVKYELMRLWLQKTNVMGVEATFWGHQGNLPPSSSSADSDRPFLGGDAYFQNSQKETQNQFIQPFFSDLKDLVESLAQNWVVEPDHSRIPYKHPILQKAKRIWSRDMVGKEKDVWKSFTGNFSLHTLFSRDGKTVFVLEFDLYTFGK
jgi:hypothetical protein